MDVAQAEHLAAQAAEHVDMEQRLDDLLSARHPPADIQLAVPARNYQLLGAAAIDIRGGLLLADDVGLGKSCTAMCLMTRPENLPALVVCETHMMAQWAGYLSQFLPALRVHTIRTGTPYPLIKSPRARQTDLWPDALPDVLLINYHKNRGWAETLAGVVRYVVFDEVQRLRNDGSEIYKAAVHVARRARRRVGLSATPINNYGAEFHPVIDALLPGALGERSEFLREWCQSFGADKQRLRDPEQFGAWLRREGIMLRRTRADVGRELPPLTKIVHTIEVDADVLRQLKGNAIALARIIVAHNEQFRGQKMQAAGEFDMLMRQATGIAKAPYVAAFVKLLIESGESVLLFAWHREVYSILMEQLAEFNPVLYTGSESPKQKEAAKQAFLAGDSRVLLMSLRSGSGVDGLQHVCKTVVFGEIDWSPAVHEQAIGRPHRDGQPEPVFAYFLLSDEGSDPFIADALGLKREQIEGVRNPGASTFERIDTGDNQIRRMAERLLHDNVINVIPDDATHTDQRPMPGRVTTRDALASNWSNNSLVDIA